MAEERYWRVPEVSKYLQVPENTHRKWISQKKVPYFKIPGSNHVRFLKEEIDNWMQKGIRGGGNGETIPKEGQGE